MKFILEVIGFSIEGCIIAQDAGANRIELCDNPGEGGTTPYRIKFRSPGFSNLSALGHMAKGGKIGDLMATMGTLDLVIPDIDR